MTGTVLAHGASTGLDRPLGFVLAVWAGGATLIVGWVYVRGLRRVLQHPQGRRRHRWRAVALGAAVVVVVVVCGTPLGEVLERRLATHMVQHLVLIMVAAPLLAWAAPGQPLLAGLSPRARARLVRTSRRLPLDGLLTPHLAWALHIGALWAWHLPAAYDAAVRSGLAHVLEHATFLGTAWLFWWHLVTVARRRMRGVPAVFYLLAAVPPGAALGAVLTFAGAPLYPDQAAEAHASGVDPLLDQRIGGLVMWVPLDLVYLLVAVLMLSAWLRGMERSWPEPELRADAEPVGGRR